MSIVLVCVVQCVLFVVCLCSLAVLCLAPLCARLLLAGLSVGVHYHVAMLSTECIKAPFNFRIVSDFVEIRNHLPLVGECLCVRHGSYLSVLTSS